MKTKPILAASAALTLATCFLAGCAAKSGSSTTGSSTAIGDITALAGDIAPLVADYARDGQINYAEAIPVALNSLAVFAPQESVLTGTLGTEISNTVAAFTNGTGTTTGQKIAAAITDGLPAVITGAQAIKLLSQASTQASAGAQSVAASPASSGTSAGIDPDNGATCTVACLSGDWVYINDGGAWPMLDERRDVSPLGSFWRDADGESYQRL